MKNVGSLLSFRCCCAVSNLIRSGNVNGVNQPGTVVIHSTYAGKSAELDSTARH